MPTYETKEAQLTALTQMVPEWAIRKSQAVKGKYTSGDYVIWSLNRIFGPHGWSTEIKGAPELVTIGESAAYSQVVVRLHVTFADGSKTYQDDVGIWPLTATGARQGGTLDGTSPERYETVIKAAVTDAIKAAAEKLGTCFRPLGDLDLDNFIRATVHNPHRGRPLDELVEEMTGEPPPMPDKPAGNRPMAPLDVGRVMIKKVEGKPQLHQTKQATKGQQGLVAAKMAECFAGESETDEMRHVVLDWLFATKSTKELTMAQAGALLDWMLDPNADEGTYDIHPAVSQEARAIYNLALREMGQMEMEIDE